MNFSYFPHQKSDLPRAAMRDGCIVAWAPGGGKTMAAYTLPLLKQANRSLLVASADLHEQLIDEGMKFFGKKVTIIRSQQHFYELVREGKLPAIAEMNLPEPDPANFTLDTEFFITDYRWLGYNGADERKLNEKKPKQALRFRRMEIIARVLGIPRNHISLAKKVSNSKFDPEATTPFAILGLQPGASKSAIKKAYRRLAILVHPDIHTDDPNATAAMQRVNEAYARAIKGDNSDIVSDIKKAAEHVTHTVNDYCKGIGESRHGIRCVFTPSLSTLIKSHFDCVVCDEAVRLKSGTAHIAHGVLNLDARYRFALTGTPIKNNLEDFFFLASWVTGHTDEATALWPYGNSIEARSEFVSDHLIIEENLTKQRKAEKEGSSRKFRKKTNKICNLHRLWKLLGPVVIRRRKDDLGASVVKKTIIPIHTPPGTLQQKCYRFHVMNLPPIEPKQEEDPQKQGLANARAAAAAKGAQLQCLRQAALDPTSAKLIHKTPSNGIKQYVGEVMMTSPNAMTPKLAATLSLITDLAEKKEQCVVFSPFQDFSTLLQRYLLKSGIKSIILDGRVNPRQRGSMTKEFKQGKHAVMIAGIDSMGEGHSLECAANLIMPSLSWAYDSNSQAIERVHRLSSKRNVTIYCIVTKNTIDERMAQVFQEKGDSSDLALDARLYEEHKEEPNLAELLRDAIKDFDKNAETLDETDAMMQWNNNILPRLKAAAQSWFNTDSPTPTQPPAPTHNPHEMKSFDLLDLMTERSKPQQSAPTNVIKLSDQEKPQKKSAAGTPVEILELLSH